MKLGKFLCLTALIGGATAGAVVYKKKKKETCNCKEECTCSCEIEQEDATCTEVNETTEEPEADSDKGTIENIKEFVAETGKNVKDGLDGVVDEIKDKIDPDEVKEKLTEAHHKAVKKKNKKKLKDAPQRELEDLNKKNN